MSNTIWRFSIANMQAFQPVNRRQLLWQHCQRPKVPKPNRFARLCIRSVPRQNSPSHRLCIRSLGVIVPNWIPIHNLFHAAPPSRLTRSLWHSVDDN